MRNQIAFILGLILVLAVGLAWVSSVKAQETQVTRCVNGKGEVIYVTNYTCPRGYWRG